MIDEYDRSYATAGAASPLRPSRLRLFLFPSKPDTAASMGSLLDDAKSETWFVDALNGSGLLLPRGLSESAVIDTLIELDRGMAAVVDSPPVVETSSSFGSSSSSPSMANLPPIRVRSEEYMTMGLDEQFSSHLNIAPILGNVNIPPVPYVNIPAAAVKGGGGGDRVIGDDEKSEKSDHGTVAPTKVRKPPLPLQPVQRKLVDVQNLPSPDSKNAGGYSLPSPESVASDCSIASGGSLAKHTIYQDVTQNSTRDNRNNPTSLNEPKMMNGQIQDPSSQIQYHAGGDSSQQQWSPQQYIPTTHYIHHQHTPIPVSSYYPLYLHHQTPPQQNDHQYPMYLMSPTTAQPSYDASSRPLTPPLPPVYPTKTEMAAAAPMQLVQVPAHQFQQHYIGVSQMQAAPNQNTPAAAAAAGGGGGGGGNYGYDQYSHHLQEQAYYAQQMAASSAPPPPPQYQTMTPAAAVMFSQASSQINSDGNPQHS